MADVHTSPDANAAAIQAADAVTQLLTGYNDVPVLFLVSGGSALAILKYLKPDIFDSRITVGVSDERFSTDPTINNFAQVSKTPWFSAVVARGVHTISTIPLPNEIVEAAGHRFDTGLKAWRQGNPAGKIIITLGIGLDGHIAGMMGYPEDERAFGFLFDDSDIWAVGYDAGKKNQYPLRVTTTLPFLRMVDDAVVFVCGVEKEVPLRAAVSKTEAPRSHPASPAGGLGALAVTPARIIHEMKHCLLYTDHPVARV